MKILDNRMIALGTLAGAMLTAAGMVAFGISYTVRIRDDATASRVCDADHEQRMRAIEGVISDVRVDVRETKTDVTWIRRFLDRHPTPAAKDDRQTAVNEP
jgi:hypothetical protein